MQYSWIRSLDFLKLTFCLLNFAQVLLSSEGSSLKQPEIIFIGFEHDKTVRLDRVSKRLMGKVELLCASHPSSFSKIIVYNRNALWVNKRRERVVACFYPYTRQIHMIKDVPERLIFHEVGHAVYFSLLNDSLRGIFVVLNEESAQEKRHFVSDYAMKNSREDFAEVYKEWCKDSGGLLRKAEASDLLTQKVLFVARLCCFDRGGKTFLRFYRKRWTHLDPLPQDVEIPPGDGIFNHPNELRELMEGQPVNSAPQRSLH